MLERPLEPIYREEPVDELDEQQLDDGEIVTCQVRGAKSQIA
jgi:hypothetical protein